MSLKENLNPPVVLFYSYSHKDEIYREELVNHLVMLQRSGLIREWHDRKILPGEEWIEQISINLENADLILLLISSDFLASKYCYDIEAKRALEKHNNGEAIVIPIILRPVTWNLTPFSKIQALPFNAQPITQWADKDSAFVSVCEGILALITSFKPESKEVNAVNTPVGFMTKPDPEPSSKLSRPKVLDAALPEQAEVGKTIVLVVMIRSEDSEGLKKIVRINTQYGVSEEDVISTGAFPLEFSIDEAGKPLPLELNIKIESPDFEQKAQTKNIRITPDGDSEPRIFLLTPKKTGDLAVNLEMYKGEEFISGCLLKTKALAAAPQNISTNLITVPINPNYSVNTNIHTTQGSSSETVDYLPASPQGNNNSPDYVIKDLPPVFGAVEENKGKSSLLLSAGVIATFSIFFVLGGASLLYLRSASVYQANTNANTNRRIKIAPDNFEFPIPALRTIQSAQKKYFLANKSRDYGTLEQLKNAGLIDETLASGESSGYKFTVTIFKLNNEPAFEVTANPLSPETRKRSFYMNEQGEIYYSEGNN